MSENISSKVLFHFTTSMVYLKSILKNGFFPHYCPEYRLDPDDKAEASKGCRPLHAAPLVSFCDLPLSLIRNHLKEYGNYGIGLKKNWGLRNGVTPVMYTHYRERTRRPIVTGRFKRDHPGSKWVPFGGSKSPTWGFSSIV